MTDESLADRFPELDATFARLLDSARAAAPAPLVDLDPAAARARARAGGQLCAPGADVLDVIDVDFDGDLRVRRYVPLQLRTRAVLVWFHGGGWVTGDLGYSDAFCRDLADGVGCEVRNVAYRLAPEHPFPAAVEDALRVVRWSTEHAPVLVGGDSAGGNLAAVCAYELRHSPGIAVRAQLLVYPVLDCDLTRASYARNAGILPGADEMSWFFDHYVPDADDRISPRFAPLRAPSLRGLPPTIIAVAGHDPLYDEGLAYAKAVEASEVPVTVLDFPSLAHGFLRFTGPVVAASDAAARIVAAIAAQVRTGQLGALG